jgi:hypothetical protein
MRSACRSRCLARFSRERDTRNHVASRRTSRSISALCGEGDSRNRAFLSPSMSPKTRSNGPQHPAGTPCDCETSGAPNGACSLGLTARDRLGDRRCG